MLVSDYTGSGYFSITLGAGITNLSWILLTLEQTWLGYLLNLLITVSSSLY